MSAPSPRKTSAKATVERPRVRRKSSSPTEPARQWQNRIVGQGEEDADQLLANPRNWRIHPKAQQDALGKVLDTVGWVGNVIVNQRTGFVVDGHLRVSLAITRGEKVPVSYVDLSEAEETLILATFDQVTQMAGVDHEKLNDLIADAVLAFPDLSEILAEFEDGNGNAPAGSGGDPDSSPVLTGYEYRVVVDCQSEAHQAEMLERFEREGIPCRALIS